MQPQRHSGANVTLVWGGGGYHRAGSKCSIISMMLVVQACKMQELQVHGGFHPDFKGKPRKPRNVLTV
jgi:hypothetical protein